MTGKEVMRLYLIENNGREIDYYTIQNELPEFASRFGVYHTPDSWTRYFRMVKDEFKLVEVEGKKWKTWKQDNQLKLAM